MWWMLGLVGCIAGSPDGVPEDGVPEDTAADSAEAEPSHVTPRGARVRHDPRTIQGHAEECEVALGPVPGFDCLGDGQEMPITIEGARPPDASWTRAMLEGTCDRPVMLQATCIPWSRVGRMQGTTASGAPDPDVDWVFTCRRAGLDGGPTGGLYDDIAMIGHRRSTGATCFFQAFPTAPRTTMPSPAASDAASIWIPPGATAGIACIRCHDADPWVHSPYIDQVRNPDDPSRPYVPEGGALDAPYHVVGQAFSGWPRPLEQIRPDGNACVGCHRIGTGDSSGMFLRYAAGGEHRMPVSQLASAWPTSHWMPPGPGVPDEATWDAVYAESVRQLVTCRAQPEAPGCGRTAIPSGR